MEYLQTYLVKIPRDNTKTASAFEDVFVQLHETLRGQKVAFELLATGQNIAFCYTAPVGVTEVIAGQIYAVAPDADIMQIRDFTQRIDEHTNIAASELTLAQDHVFPLKDYRDFDGDSLSGILSVLSKCVPGERVIIQIVVQPVKDSAYHHMVLNKRKVTERSWRMFRIKYWFKRGVVKTFDEKISEKTSTRLYSANIRIGSISDNPDTEPEQKLGAVIGAMSNFNTLDLNQLSVGRVQYGYQVGRKFQQRALKKGFMLSTKELATMFHLPTEDEVPNLVHVLSRKAAPPSSLPTNQRDKEISFFGVTNFRDQRVPFGIKAADRRRHLYVVGKSGSGKSKLIQLLVKDNIDRGKGVGVLDPHGDLVDEILTFIPEHRMKDVIIFDPSDLQFPPSFNPLEQVPEELKMRVTIGFIEIFKKLFGSNWSPRLEHVLRYTTLALLDTPNTTVLSILKMLTDKNYRQMIVRNIQDNVVKNFWVSEFAGWSEKFDNEAITPLLNKVGQFVATNMIRNIVGQPQNAYDFREILDNRKILLMKVSKGVLGEENAALLGAIVVTKIYQAAMARADTPEKDRVDFYFYVDEFHNFATDSFDEILSEARKYRLNMTLANQFLGQLPDNILRTVFGNVGSLVSFRVGGEDARILADEFKPRFTEADLINLAVRDFAIKMSIDGEVQEAFSGKTLKIDVPEQHHAQECIEHSRKHYARPLDEVKNILARWEDGEYDPKVDEQPASSSPSPFDEQVEFEEPII